MGFAELVNPGSSRWLKSRYYDWLEKKRTPEFQKLEAETLTHILTKNEERIRTGSWSASSSGNCKRKQEFVYLGAKKKTLSPKSMNIFRNGDYMHLRHQVAGLMDGYLIDVEVPVTIDDYFVRGTIDAICSDGAIVDFKSINTYGFASLEAPHDDHIDQLHAYMIATGRRKARLLYEDKNNQDIKEFNVEWDESRADRLKDEWDDLNIDMRDKVLHKPLPINSDECRWCDFSRICREVDYKDVAQ